MIRVLQWKLILLCCLAAVAPIRPAGAVTLQQEGALLHVRTRTYDATLEPANGGRITSLRVDGAETTRICADGRGGLFAPG